MFCFIFHFDEKNSKKTSKSVLVFFKRKAFTEYSKIADTFFLVAEKEIPSIDTKTVILSKKIDACQLVFKDLVDIKITENIVLLILRLH